MLLFLMVSGCASPHAQLVTGRCRISPCSKKSVKNAESAKLRFEPASTQQYAAIDSTEKLALRMARQLRRPRPVR